MAKLTGFSGEIRWDAGKPSSQLRRLDTTRVARPLRFALTGGLAGLLQLGLLALLTGRGWPTAPSNAVAFLLAAQVNFVLSSLFTWRDRRRTAPLWRRWLAFHGAIIATALVNQSVFLAARTELPALVASAAGIVVAAVGNYLLGDRLVFGAHNAAAREGHTDGRHAWDDHAA